MRLVCPLHSHCNPLSLSLPPPSLPPSPSFPLPPLPPSLPPSPSPSLPPSLPPSLSSGPRTSPRAAAIPGPHVLLRAEGAQNWQNQEQEGRGIECRMNAVRVCLCGPIRVLTLVYIPQTTCTLVLAIYIASFPVSTPRLFFALCIFHGAKKSWGVETGNEANLYTLHRPLLSPSFSSPPLLILLPVPTPPLLILLPVPAPPLLILLPVPTPPLLILLPYITSEGLEYFTKFSPLSTYMYM